MIETLRQRNFALFWLGQLASKLGDWVLWIALPFYVYEQTGSTLATGAMFIVTNLPTLLFNSLAGVFVDNWDRRKTMIVADLLRAIIILLLLLTRLSVYLWLLYPLAFLQSLVSQFFTPAKSAILPTLVRHESLMKANTLTAVSGKIAMIIGPAISGLIYSATGLTGVILIDTFSYILSALLIWLIQVPTDPKDIGITESNTVKEFMWRDLWQQWMAGLGAVRKNSTIYTLFIVMGVANIGNGIILVSWIIHVREVLDAGVTLYGWVQVAVAAGGILASVFMTKINKLLVPWQLISASGITVGVLLFLTFNIRSIPMILGLQLFMGIVAMGFYVPIETLLQSSTNKDFLGRIFGAYGTTNALLILAGQLMATVLGDKLGPTTMLNIAAFMAFFGGICGFALPLTNAYSSSGKDLH